MLIDLPVTILFDCQDYRDIGKPGLRPFERIITLRYDTEDMTCTATYTGHYPPRENAHWSEDADGVFFCLMSEVADKAIIARAARYPAEYHADPAEGDRLQKIGDEERQRDRDAEWKMEDAP